MIYQNQTVALFPCIEPDPSRAAFVGTGLGPAGLRIRSCAIAALNELHGGDTEVRLRFLTSTDDSSEGALLKNLDLEDAGVTIICLEPSVIRSTLRLRTALLLDSQPGGAEALHRQISCSTWVRAVRPADASSYQSISDLRERDCTVAVSMLLDELARRRVTQFGQRKFEVAVELLKASANEAGFDTLAGRIAGMRSAALDL